ncbi:MAG: SDR family oxidoreductase [Deltaproteobacteria bacterium]|nr:SDR family oxidoreductase [Deltaproteobacteria bacterium]
MRRGFDTVAFVTGFPALTARRMIVKILENEPRTFVYFLVRPKFGEDAAALEASLAPAVRRRLEPLEGDIAHMDMGLSGKEWLALSKEVDEVHHIASIHYLGVDAKTLEAVNVTGAREIIDLCRSASGIRRLHFWSSAYVSGDRNGLVLETELEKGQGFHNEYERTKFRAERILRRVASTLPITVYRPTSIVGDSRTGEIDRLDGPYHVVSLIVRSPVDVSLPLPGRADGHLHLVPLDYVVDAAYAIGRRPESAGGTFHLVDPAPLSAREAFALVAKAAHRRIPRGFIPTPVTRALLKTPGLERLSRSTLGFVETLGTDVIYDSTNTRTTLEGTGIACPPLETYVDKLVEHVRERLRKQHAARQEEALDPLA